jgi:hypothetical protein
MPISFVAAGAVATGTNPTVAVPAGYALNDLLVIITTGTATPATPSGWTSRGAQGATGFVTILSKFAAASESSVALTLAGTTSKAVMVAYRGVSGTDTISAFTAQTGTTLATATLTTSNPSSYVISVYGSTPSSASWTAPASTTARVNSASTLTLSGLLVVDELQAAAGVSTARTATVSASSTLSAVAISITPNDRYWVGGTATWDGTAGTKWSTVSGGAGGAPVPTDTTPVFFTNLSTGTCTISTVNALARSLNCTGFTGTIAGSQQLRVYGDITLVAGQGFTYAGPVLILNAGLTLFTATLTTAGKTLVSFQSSGPVSVNLGDALTCSGGVSLSATGATFNTTASNFSITCASLSVSFNNTLTLNGSTVTITGSDGFDANASSTINAGTSTINLSSSIANFEGGGKTYNNVSFTSTAVSNVDITSANTFANLTLTAPGSTGRAAYSFAANQTITTFVAAGASAVRRVFIRSDTLGTRRTLTVTTWSTISDVDFRDIGMNSSRSGTRLGNCGNNLNITFAAAKTVFWNLTGTQNWSATGWATTSGGTPAVNNFPLAQDTAVFDNTGAATTVSFDASWNIGTLSMGSRTNAMTLSGGAAPSVYGDWTTGSGVTLSFTNSIIFAKTGTQTLTSAGKSFFGITVNAPSSLVLADALVTTTTGVNSLFVSGNINAVSYSVTSDRFYGAGTTALGTGTWTITGVSVSGGPWTQGGTVTGSGEIILSNTTTGARTFAGGGKTYGKLTIGGATGTSTLTITGANTFTEIASTKTVAHTIIFPNATTTVGAFTVQGSSGKLVTLSRTGASGTFTLAKTGGGTVNSQWLSISNSTASPSNTWFAANSTDGGNNTGWVFGSAGGGNFLAFFM